MDQPRIDLRDHLHPGFVVQLKARTKDAVLEEIVRAVQGSPDVKDMPGLLSAVREREALLSTGIGLGIAIPHARIASVTRFVVAVGRCTHGIEFGSIDGKPVSIVVLIAGPQDAQKPYLELLAQISRRLKLAEVRERITGGASADEVVRLLTAR
jgi:mannitol/fructose-specific phosphotransferase system IIA component (Ntr-type)